MNNCNNKEIDLVYLWVDGNDPTWQEKRNACIGKPKDESGVNCAGRYANHDELKFSLRSIEKYAPWIHKIFIVTDHQVPAWLDLSHPKIKIIDHQDIMPKDCLPCFNSALIEHFIYRIPNLAEHFIYANDDMLINRPVTPESFFAKDGLPIVRLNRRPFRRWTLLFKEKVLKKPLSNYNITIRNSAELVYKKYGIYFNGKTHHNIDAYLKSTYQYTSEIFKNEIAATYSNHVRSANDIQRNIYSYVALAEKRAHLKYVNLRTSFRLHIDNEGNYRKLEKYNPLLFCMNDSEFAHDCDREKAAAFLEKRFPQKSQFEK